MKYITDAVKINTGRFIRTVLYHIFPNIYVVVVQSFP